jgi:hypothetical protein
MQEETCHYCGHTLYADAIITVGRTGELIRICGFSCARTRGQSRGAPPPSARSATNRSKLALPTLTELLTRSRF